MHPVAIELLARAKDGEGVKSGPLGLAVILVLCVVCYFLFKSMSKHMRKVREDFPKDEPKPTASAPTTEVQTDESAAVAKAPPSDSA
jgi:hypothetical protein